MATTTGPGNADKARTAGGAKASQQELEIEIARLREDMAKLAEQLARTGETSYSAARRAANEGMDQLRVQGEAAIEGARATARDYEKQLTDTVREKPITSLAIAAGVGFLFALLTRR